MKKEIQCNHCGGKGHERWKGEDRPDKPCKKCDGTGRQEVMNRTPQTGWCPDCDHSLAEHEAGSGCGKCRCERGPKVIEPRTRRCANCERCKIQSGDGLLRHRLLKLGRETGLFSYFFATDGKGGLHEIELQKLKGRLFATCKKGNWKVKNCTCIANPRDLWSRWFRTEADFCMDYKESLPQCAVGNCDGDVVRWSDKVGGFICVDCANALLPDGYRAPPDRRVEVTVAPEIQSALDRDRDDDGID